MVPTLCRTLGVKGYHPVVGTWDCKHLLYVFAVLNVVTAALHTTTLASRADATRRTGKNKTCRLQAAFDDRLRHIGRVYPQGKYPHVVLIIDNAPWHVGYPSRRRSQTTPTWRCIGCPAIALS
jgi:hypothetical protein